MAYTVYALCIVPLIDGRVAQKQIETRLPSETNNQRYAKLITTVFPADDWIRGRCKILDARQSILFFKEARQLEDGNWEVKPVTMFLNPGKALVNSETGELSEAPEKPIILRTEEGAYLNFEDGTSINSPSGKFSSARMPGKVIVFREASMPGSDDNFEFITRNIQVNKKQILAVNPVEFKYGKHFGSGHNLTINLGSLEKSKTNRLLPLVQNLKTVELAHLEKIMLLPETSGESLSSETGLTGDSMADLEGAPVKVTCAGPFRLDFGKSQMVLFDQVHVEQLHRQSKPDHLYCDRLEVNFRLKAKDGQGPKEKIKLQTITAFGQPAALHVDSRGAYAQARQITYQLGRRIIHCQSNVLVRDNGYQFQAPEMQYQLTRNNQLGTGWATGPGEVTARSADQDGFFQAAWGSELNIQPQDGKKAISIHGNAHIVLRQNQHFRCEELHFWIWEKRKRGPQPKWDLIPAQLLGLRDVEVNAPEFAGKVDEFRLYWPRPIAPGSSNRITENPQTLKKKAATKNPSRLSFASSRSSSPKLGNARQPNTTRIVGKGHLATAHLTRSNELKSFRVEGKPSGSSSVNSEPDVAAAVDLDRQVHVQSINLKPDENGGPTSVLLDVKGTAIQVDSTRVQDAYKIGVTGFPSTIAAEGIKFKADKLIIDQSTNKAWTDVPGNVEISPAIQSSVQSIGPEPKTNIYWNQRFEFDGRVLRLTDKIRFDGMDYLDSGEQVVYEGETTQLAAAVNRRIDFLQANGPSKLQRSKAGLNSKTSIQELALLGKARIKTTTRESINEVKSTEELYAREINIRTDTGDARAIGPGSLRSIRRNHQTGNQDQVALIPDLASSPSNLSYLQVAFDGQIIGNLKFRQGTINEKVRAVYGPVDHWNASYDPNATSIQGEEIYINCNQMKFSQWQPVRSDKPLVEISAVGNTEIEGKKFRALATQLSYTEENEILQLEGLDRNDAKIWFRKNENHPWQYGEAKKFRYQRSSSEIIGSEDLKEMRFLQLEAPQKRKR
ncbi:MAG: hypothetical protein VX438_10240 [Planctomycetota bacterium]|nr:hypothetical protein [Planctomycetota bacterium]